MKPIDYPLLPSIMDDLDAVFNTVPITVLSEEMLSKLRDGVPVIELASKPGGIDPVGAIRYGTRVISAQSLPGRVAPVTAGKIIARCIIDKISGGRT
jgi:dipicolinate synthase subunit A